MTALPSIPVLVRTWFGDKAAWEALVEEVRTPSEDDFLANVTRWTTRRSKDWTSKR
jgi:hypothetical protein